MLHKKNNLELTPEEDQYIYQPKIINPTVQYMVLYIL